MYGLVHCSWGVCLCVSVLKIHRHSSCIHTDRKAAPFIWLTDQVKAHTLILFNKVSLIATIYWRGGHSLYETPLKTTAMLTLVQPKPPVCPVNPAPLWMHQRSSEGRLPVNTLHPFDLFLLFTFQHFKISFSHNHAAQGSFSLHSQTACSAPLCFASNSISPLSYLALHRSFQLIWLRRESWQLKNTDLREIYPSCSQN